MDRRQISGVVAGGLFTTGGGAIWASLNPALPAPTSVFVRLVGIFAATTGLLILGVLFATARSARAAERKKAEIKRELAARLAEGQALLRRSRQPTDPQLGAEVATWYAAVKKRLLELDPAYPPLFDGDDGLPITSISSPSLSQGLATGLRNRLIQLERIVVRLG